METVRLLIEPLAFSLHTAQKGLTLLFTGHSAGAAIASLLYAHVKTTNTSALVKVAEKFDRIHCIVFGAPPISTAPLQEYTHSHCGARESLFLSLINDGDPITKADIGYISKKYRWLTLSRPHLNSVQETWWDRSRKQELCGVAKPANRLFVNSGTLIMMRVNPALHQPVSVRRIYNNELEGDAVLTWRAHGIRVYKERIASFLATTKSGKVEDVGAGPCNSHPLATSRDIDIEGIVSNGWITLLFL